MHSQSQWGLSMNSYIVASKKSDPSTYGMTKIVKARGGGGRKGGGPSPSVVEAARASLF